MKKFDLKKGLALILLIISGAVYCQTDNTIRLTSNGVAIGGVNPDEGSALAQDDTVLTIDAAGAVTVNPLDPDYTFGSNTGVVTFADALSKTFTVRLRAAQVIDQTPGSTYGAITTTGGIDRASDGAIGVRPPTGTLNYGIDNGEGLTFGFSASNLPTSVTLQITRIYFTTFGLTEGGVIVNRRDTSKKLEFTGPETGTNIIQDVAGLDLYLRGGSTLFDMVSIFNNSSTVQSWRVSQIEFRLVETNSLTTTWNGSVWSAFTPNPNINAIIAGNYSALTTGGFSAKSLTINSGTLSIEATKAVKVDNEVINNAGPTGIIVYSNGGLTQVNNTVNSGAITVRRDSSPLSRLDSKAWSSPMAGQNLLNFSPGTLSSNFLNFDEGTGQYTAVASPSTTEFASATGYLISMPDNAVTAPATQTFEGVFTGVTNNGNISKSVSNAGSGYNLIGNPYPSSIVANSFINANSSTIDGGLYFWRKTSSTSGSAYAMYSILGETSVVANSTETNVKIPVGEGFLVKAKNAADVNFTNAMRIAATPAALTADRVWLNLTNSSGVFSQALIGYTATGTVGLDVYDGKYINDSPVALTSNLNNEEYTIQGRPAFDASDEVNLNFKTNSAGSYTIGVDHFDGVFSAGQEIYLKDNMNGTYTDLRTNSYTFTAAAGTDNSRFVLRYRAASYPIAATAGDNGSVSGAGTYNTYSTATLIATPSEGYGLINWTENGNQVSASPTYTFQVTGARTLVANFGFVNVTNVTACTSYIWNGIEYTTSGIYIGDTIEGVVQKLNLTILPLTTTGTETVSACGSSYTWAVNGTNYTESGIYTHVVGCNTATLTLTLTPATSNTTTISSFGTYTWANNGETYTTSGVKTGTTTNCVTELLDLTITTTQIPTTFPAFCKGATVATATGSTTMKFYAAATGGLPLAGTIALSNAKTYFVSEVINSVETARVSRFITVNNLPSTPSLLVSSPLDESKLICKYIGSSTPVTFNVTATGAVSYIWTVPAGASIVSGDTTSSVGVSFAGASTTPGVIGAVTVKSVDTNGCASLAKSLTLSTKLPTAPASLVMTSADSTPHFDVITTPAVIGVSPAIYSTVGLNYLTKITKVGPYIGTNTVFTLTAPTSTTAASYAWTLPSGATQLSGGSSNVITVDFAGVPSGIGSLPIVVKSVGGCGLSSARTLTLGRTVPGAPKALVLTNTSQSNLSGLTKITKVGPYTGTNISFTLTATPFRTQGATSTSYAWVLPAGVTCTTASTPTNVNVIIPPTVEGGLPTVNVVPAISTPTSTITVNFSTATGSGNLELSVFGVNGAGNSVARKLVLARALPSSPTKLVLTDDAISTTLAVTKVGPYTAKTTPLTLTATPFLTQGAEATSFVWTLPTGVNVTAGATLVSNNGATRTFSGTATVLTINLAGISGNSPSATSLPMSVSAVNGVGTSLVPRTLTVTAAAPTAPAIVGSTGTTYSSCVNTTYTATLFQGATYAWTIPAGASIVGVTNGNVIVVDYSGVSVPVNGSSAVTCIATNGVGSSPAKSLTVKRVAGTCRLSNSSASAFTAKAYPNPSSSEFTIETSAKGAMSVKVYDMQGRLVEKADTNKVGSKLAAGTYNVIVNQGANTKSVRVIKK